MIATRPEHPNALSLPERDLVNSILRQPGICKPIEHTDICDIISRDIKPLDMVGNVYIGTRLTTKAMRGYGLGRKQLQRRFKLLLCGVLL